ncbi:MAG: gliding motility protein GldC [Flavobacteriales bacterium]|nr:gliding motility protein GldC [Flavobacteriales bacterium]
MSDSNMDIIFSVKTDENKIPEKIEWEATDENQKSECKAILVSVWDKDQQNTMGIDLWTKDMTVDEMKQFFHQTLLSMSESFQRATGEDKIVGDMQDFCFHFADKMNIVQKES